MTLPRLLAVAWTLLILAACSIPAPALPAPPTWSFDKVVHFGLFAVLGIAWMWALRGPLRRRAAWVLVGGGAYAVLTELYQGLLGTGRQADPFDALANGAGLLAALLIVTAWHRWRPKHAPS